MTSSPADAAYPNGPHGSPAADGDSLGQTEHLPSNHRPDHEHGHGHGHGEHPPHLAHHFDTPEQQFESGKLGMWVFLATELLMFGGLFCAYAVYRGNHPGIFEAGHRALSPTMGTINTVVLLASSLTMAWGVRAAQLGQRKLLVVLLLLTLLGGFGFMTIKAEEYAQKFEHGFGPGVLNVFYFQGGSARSDEAYMHGVEQLQGQGHEPHHAEPEGEHAEGETHQGEVEAAGGNPRQPDTAGSGGDNPPQLPSGGAAGPASYSPLPDRPDEGGGEGGGQNGETGGTDSAPAVKVNPAMSKAAAAALPVQTSAKPPVDAPTGLAAWVFTPGEKAVAGHGLDFEAIPADDQGRLTQFFSIYFLMTGLHGVHVLIGMGLITYLLYRAGSGVERSWTMPLVLGISGLYIGFLWFLIGAAWLGITAAIILVAAAVWGGIAYSRARREEFQDGDFGPEYYTPVDLIGLYWHLVDLIWIFLFPLLYLIH